jgi:hypothetical protein
VGIHVGENPSDAVNALMQQGYRITSTSRSESFTQRLSDAKNAQLRPATVAVRNTDIASIAAEQGDQRIRVNFDDDAAGVRAVSSVHYDASSLAHPFDRVLKTLIERYGRPQAGDGTGSVWKLLCRMGRHVPLRDTALIDLREMRQSGRCKRCGAPMERDRESPWRLQDSGSAGQPIESAAREGRSERRAVAATQRARPGA